MQTTLDHLILGINNLENGIKEFYELTGVKPIFGGKHPGIGTHNALVSLSDGKYLEIIAPVDNSKLLTGPFQGLNQFEKLTPAGWVIGSQNLKEIKFYLDYYKIKNTGVLPLSRKTADGEEIHWKNIFLMENGGMSVNPFFIQWEADGIHPSEVTPKGCSLVNFTIGKYSKNSISAMLQGLEMELNFEESSEGLDGRLLQFRLNSPNGIIHFQQ